MRIMRPPQHGQHRDGTMGASGAGASAIGLSATVTALFGLYAAIGLLTFFLYRHLSPEG